MNFFVSKSFFQDMESNLETLNKPLGVILLHQSKIIIVQTVNDFTSQKKLLTTYFRYEIAGFSCIIPPSLSVLLLNQYLISNIHPMKHHQSDAHAQQSYFDRFTCLVTPE